jgi:hypothetical protein
MDAAAAAAMAMTDKRGKQDVAQGCQMEEILSSQQINPYTVQNTKQGPNNN